MADNHYQANTDHSPFRRYEPPANAGDSAAMPAIKPPPLSSGAPSGVTSRGAKRRQRQARSRWRQWLPANQPKTSTQPAARSATPAPNSRARSPQPRVKSVPSVGPSPHPKPLGAERAMAEPPMVNTPSRFVQPSPSDSVLPPQGRGAAPAPKGSRSRQATTPRPKSKVTPLRRPASSDRSGSPGPAAKPRRRAPKRTRKTPQPILYGIRLLILGTGIAAIAGTVLSSIKPQTETAQSETSGLASSSEPTGRSNTSAAALSQPLPLATELVAVETDLVALESMTPGLSQSVFFYDLETGNYIDLNGTASLAAASTIKVPILVAFLQAVDAGAVSLNQALTLEEAFIAGGSGELQTQAVGSQYTALEVATEMIINSDNTATNMMIALLGGQDVLNQQFRDWGLEETMLRNLLPDLDGTNTTSAADLVRVLALVDQGELLSRRSRDRLFNIMQRTYNRTYIPDGIGDETALAFNKTGDIGTFLADVALIDVANGNRYILSVLVERPFNDGRASELIRRTAGRIHEEMNQPVSPEGTGNLAVPATGDNSPEGDRPTPDSEEIEPEPYVEPGTPLSSPEIPPG